MTDFLHVLDKINDWVWGPPLIILMVFTGIYLTFRTRGVQFRHLWLAHKMAITRHDDGAQG
ncbi:MAG: sodium:alanine symporter family protein, partial [Simkaniaceae bacterium]|nr:sodium:alanine symporter family protein [Simkaniaceae bacterium]